MNAPSAVVQNVVPRLSVGSGSFSVVVLEQPAEEVLASDRADVNVACFGRSIAASGRDDVAEPLVWSALFVETGVGLDDVVQLPQNRRIGLSSAGLDQFLSWRSP